MKNIVIELVERTHDFYVGAFNDGQWFTRRQFSEANNIPYTTVVYNLDQAVKHGKLIRHKYLVKGQPTWIYGLPETMQKLALRSQK